MQGALIYLLTVTFHSSVQLIYSNGYGILSLPVEGHIKFCPLSNYFLNSSPIDVKHSKRSPCFSIMIMGKNRVLCCRRANCLCLTNEQNLDHVCLINVIMCLAFEGCLYLEKCWEDFQGDFKISTSKNLKVKIKIACSFGKVHDQCSWKEVLKHRLCLFLVLQHEAHISTYTCTELLAL